MKMLRFFFFKQKTAYEMRISDWSSDVCSSDLLAALAEYDAPSLVHCVAGKDRTGFAVAIVHRLLGVHDDDLMHDYLLTNTAGRIEERIAQGAAHIRARYGAEIKDEAVRTIIDRKSVDVGKEGVRTGRSRWAPYH